MKGMGKLHDRSHASLIQRELSGRSLSPRARERLARQLETCPPCARQRERALHSRRLLVSGRGEEPTGLELRLLFERSLQAAGAEPREPARVWTGLRLALPLATLVLVFLLPLTSDRFLQPEYSGIRGESSLFDRGPALGISGVGAMGDEYEVVHGEGVFLGDWLRFYLSGTPGTRTRYFILGVQDPRDPAWYFPNSTEGRSLEMPTPGKRWMIPEEIQLAPELHRPGELTVIALFTEQALTLEQVREAVAEVGSAGWGTAREIAGDLAEALNLEEDSILVTTLRVLVQGED